MVSQWGKWEKTSVQTFPNRFLKTLTQRAVTTEAGSLFQYFTPITVSNINERQVVLYVGGWFISCWEFQLSWQNYLGLSWGWISTFCWTRKMCCNDMVFLQLNPSHDTTPPPPQNQNGSMAKVDCWTKRFLSAEGVHSVRLSPDKWLGSRRWLCSLGHLSNYSLTNFWYIEFRQRPVIGHIKGSIRIDRALLS